MLTRRLTLPTAPRRRSEPSPTRGRPGPSAAPHRGAAERLQRILTIPFGGSSRSGSLAFFGRDPSWREEPSFPRRPASNEEMERWC
jgi:hypothetical protein